MLSDDWAVWIVNILLAMFATHIFFFYFDIFFEKSKRTAVLSNGPAGGKIFSPGDK